MVGFPKPFDYDRPFHVAVLQPPSSDGFGLFRFRSPLLTESLLFSFPPGTKMFQFPGLSSMSYVLAQRWYRITDIRLPHSEIPGSLSVYDSPRRFAVNCVLHQLYVPRHSPYALSNLIYLRFPIYLFLRTVLLYKLFSFTLFFSVTIFSQLLRKTISICYSVFKEHSPGSFPGNQTETYT